MDDLPLEPLHWASSQHEQIPLYEGRLRISNGAKKVTLEGYVDFGWLPAPGVTYEAWGSSGLLEAVNPFQPEALTIEVVDVPSQAVPNLIDTHTLLPPDRPGFRMSGLAPTRPALEFGDSANLGRVLFGVVNFSNVVGSEISASVGEGTEITRRMVLVADGWRITLQPRRDLRDAIRQLFETGGFDFTHTGQLERSDGTTFSAEAANDVADTLWHVLAFADGALTGLALFEGFDDAGERVWSHWRSDLADRWLPRTSWCDRATPQCLTDFFPLFFYKCQDAFWERVLKRAVRYFVDGNRGDSIEKAIVMTQAGLEILAWSILDKRRLTSVQSGRPASQAAPRLEALMEWVQLPLQIPSGLSGLKGWASSQGASTAAEALTKVRNRITHPDEIVPTTECLIDTQMFATRLLELLVLRVVDYDGPYFNRLTVPPVVGQVEAVPWN